MPQIKRLTGLIIFNLLICGKKIIQRKSQNLSSHRSLKRAKQLYET